MSKPQEYTTGVHHRSTPQEYTTGVHHRSTPLRLSLVVKLANRRPADGSTPLHMPFLHRALPMMRASRGYCGIIAAASYHGRADAGMPKRRWLSDSSAPQLWARRWQTPAHPCKPASPRPSKPSILDLTYGLLQAAYANRIHVFQTLAVQNRKL